MHLHFYKQFWVFVLFLLCAQMAQADTVTIYEDKGRYALGTDIQFLEDKTGKRTIYEIASGDFDSLFVSSTQENPNFGYSESVYWARFTLDNQTTRKENFFLEFNYPLLDNIELYYKESGKWQVKKAGDIYPFREREIKNRHVLFSLFLPVWEMSTYYVRIESRSSSIQVPVTLWQPIAFDEYNHNLQFILGIIYGIILLIIVENLFLFFSTRNYTYLYYVFAMLTSIMLIATLNGHAFEYIWTDFIWIQNNILPLLVLSLGFWMGTFCRRFLDTKYYSPLSDRILLGFLWVQGFISPLTLMLPYQYAIRMAALVAILEAMFLVISSAVTAWRGNFSARYFTIAFSCYLVGMAIYGAKSVALIQVNFFTEYSVQIGAAIQVTLLSFALGAKLKELEQERVKAQNEALQLQQEVNEQLEHKVEERMMEVREKTAELEQAYKNVSLLSRIGQEITSTLEFEDIFTKLYTYVNDVMDASIFGVDIYYPDKQILEYKLNIENNQRLPSEIVSMSNNENLSVWTVKNRKEMIMNDVENEYHHYVSTKPQYNEKQPLSIINIPLALGDRVLGVATVQSYRRHAYTKQHVEIMRTLASYTSIALDNAYAYDHLAETTNNMINSIRYAKRIQDSILPAKEIISSSFADNFIFYKPRDIVSGDFYWFAEQDGLLVIAAVDCTGHGVPGAFMTMMGNDLLNQIVIEKGITNPEAILCALDKRVIATMHSDNHSEQKRNDGMDIAICTIDRQNQTLYFAGAKSPIFYVHDGQLDHIKGSVFPIGSTQFKREKIFKNHIFNYVPGDIVYIFSDGYHDQFGGTDKQKYMTKRFRTYLSGISHLPMGVQKDLLAAELEEWKGTNRQTDDVLVIGIKL